MNMEFSKVYIVEFKDLNPPYNPKELFAEVVLIDRSHPAVQPLLYQLNSEALPSQNQGGVLRNNLISMARESFREVGPIVSIDRKNKLIRLEDQTNVTYKYLIIASGSENTQSGGLQTLFDALRIKNLPFHIFEQDGVLLQNLKLPNAKKESADELTVGRKLIEKMVNQKSNEISPSSKIYEVQL